jgi:uncharacterized membrane protein HdeD (DUF308 family)
MSSAAGSSGQSNRTTALVLLAVGVVVCVIGIVFIATNHDLRATASFIVGVVALIGGGFMLARKPKSA